MDINKLTLDVDLKIDINAPIEDVFEGFIHRITDGNVRPDGVPMLMKLERWPGGRWYRDLGDKMGHLWAHVQSIKAPTLLEFTGPMFMSYPVAGHMIVRLSEIDGGCRITLRHRVFGLIDDEHREGVTKGWNHYLQGVKAQCEK